MKIKNESEVVEWMLGRRKKKKYPFFRWIILSHLFPIIGGYITQRSKIKDKDLKEFCTHLSFYNPFTIRLVLTIIFVMIFRLSFSISQNTMIAIQILFSFAIRLSITYLTVTNMLKSNKYKKFYPVFTFGAIGSIYSMLKESKDKVDIDILTVFQYYLIVAIVQGLIMRWIL